MVAIDGKQVDMDRIDLRAKVGEKEVWEIKNTRDMMGGMIHPFHLHGVQFKVIIRNGNAPPANEQGWKDTIALYPGDSVRIEVTFQKRGFFMYHGPSTMTINHETLSHSRKGDFLCTMVLAQ
ncbi:TPA: multicopper oxidase domain-containing protein [Streptococcus suis]